jgi:pyruvate,water dikinase
VENLATDAGVPELLTTVYSAFGQVSETAMAEDLWQLSRGHLTEQEFLRRHGYHGTAAGNVTGVSWRMDLTPIRGVVKAMARRPDTEHPLRRAQAATTARIEAEQTLRAALPRHKRPLLTSLLKLGASRTRCQEQTKTAFTMAIDGSRAAMAILGPELAAAGLLETADDALFLTIDEHLAGPTAASAELAAFRHARRDEYRHVALPTTFVGMPEPLDVDAAIVATGSTTVTGVAASAGIAEGRARVMVDLDDAGDLEPGEILVCRHTDPAWTAAMALADALVIDIGAPGSHGAIVARELGIPCVIGTTTGTSDITTGDLVRVDGNLGRVEILVRPDQV